MKKKFCIIINPVAGKGRTSKKIPILKNYLESQNFADFDLCYTEYHEHAIKLANMRAKEYDAVIAMGGDGTINEVLKGLIGTDTIMGIIPEGRGNDFARYLHFPSNIKEAVDKLIKFDLKTIDIGKIDTNYFMNGVGIGFDGFVNQRTLKRKILKGALSYYYSMLEGMFLWQPMKMNVEIDNTKIDSNSVFLTAIGNGKFCGGGMNLNPHAEIDDGLLDLCVVNNISKMKVVRNLKKLVDGTIDNIKEVTIYKGKEIKISSEDNMPIHYDGELYFPEKNEVEISIHEKAIKMIE